MLWLYHRTEGIIHVQGSAATEIVGDSFICRSSTGELVAEFPRLDVLAFTDKPHLLPLWERALAESADDELPGPIAFSTVRHENTEKRRPLFPQVRILPALSPRFA